MTVSLIALAAMSYLLGSIPFSFIAGKLFKGIDLREHGSGNLGATNTYRMLGLVPAIVVGVLDALKGYLPVLLFPGIVLAASNGGFPMIVAGTESVILLSIFFGLFAISGHIWTLFLGFKGGKGVTTAFGVFLAIAPLSTALSLLCWILILFLSRTVSIASISTAILFPVFLLLFRENLLDSEILLFAFAVLTTFLVLYTHRTNIIRLMKGEEKRIGREEN